MSLFADTPQLSGPEWANFFSLDEYAQFLGHVHDYFGQEGIEASIEDGIVTVEADNQKLGLQNLAQLCFHSSPEKWQALVFNHFARVRAAYNEDEIRAQAEAMYDDVADQLAIRMWPKGMLEAMNSAELVYRELIPDIVSVLVYDAPESISTVNWQTVARWDMPMDDIFDRAFANVRNGDAPKLTRIPVENDVEITVFLSESFFMTTHALFLKHYPECIGNYGTLLGIPHRHALLVYPINDGKVLDALTSMAIAAYNMHSEGPGSISPFLYWFTGKEYVLLPAHFDDNQMTFLPPQEFVELLDKIAVAN